MPGGVAGVRPIMAVPYADYAPTGRGGERGYVLVALAGEGQQQVEQVHEEVVNIQVDRQ